MDSNSDNYKKALIRIRELYGKINKNSDLFSSKNRVMSDYQNLFSSPNVSTIGKEEFVEFLHFKNNHHWTSLDRQAKNLTSDMVALRKALSELVDGSRPISNRIDNLTHVKGLGEGIFTPILLIASNQKFAVWNSKSAGFLSKYGIKPSSSGKSTGRYYEEVNMLFSKLSKDANLDLWTLDALFHYDLYIQKIPEEIESRKKIWKSLKMSSDGETAVSDLFAKGLRIGQRQLFLHLNSF